MKHLSNFLYLFLSFIWSEIAFKLLLHFSFDISFIVVIFIVLFLSSLFALIAKLLGKYAKVFTSIVLFVSAFIYCMQLCVFKMFGFYFDFSILTLAKQVPEFIGDAIALILSNWYGILILLMPFIAYFFIKKKFVDGLKPIKAIFIIIVSLCIGLAGSFGLMFKNKDEQYSAYDLTFKSVNTYLSINKLGVLGSFDVDLVRFITGFEEEIEIEIIEEPEPEIIPEKEYTYHKLDIDFDSLIENEKNVNIKTIHEYFKAQNGTLENDYTGLYEGKNLIVFMAESFNEIGVFEDLTPTIYKLVHDGYYFENYYSPSMHSTVGGEAQFNTALYPLLSFPEIWKAGTNYWPMGIANMFKKEGYSAYAYHNNAYDYLDRNKYLKSVGFDNYQGCWNGLEKKMNCAMWPESDLDMVEGTYQDYINEDKFLAYYMTVSGHGQYSYSTDMGSKYKQFILDSGYNYSEKIMAYLSSMVEFDRMLEATIKHLKEAGKLEDTVIVVVGDHYPYYLDESEINQLAGKSLEQYVEVCKNNLIIYNPGNEDVKIDKVCATMDVLPTIYNLFGFDYDSRLFIGSDIFSESTGIAIFGNSSWVTDKGMYLAHLNKYEALNGEDIDETYFNNINKYVSLKEKISLLVAQNDYYRIVWPNK